MAIGVGTAALTLVGGAVAMALPGSGGHNVGSVPGDNGTVKIHEVGVPAAIDANDPHVCHFYLDAFNFDTLQQVSWTIDEQPPSGTALATQGTITLASGSGHTSPISLPDGHYKLTWHFAGQHGQDKHKVFWVSCLTPPPPTTTSPSTHPSTHPSTTPSTHPSTKPSTTPSTEPSTTVPLPSEPTPTTPETEPSTQPTETTKPTEPTPTTTVSTEPTSTTQPTETKPSETTPTETRPTETKPTETKPTETRPTETKSTEPTTEKSTSKPTTEPSTKTSSSTQPTSSQSTSQSVAPSTTSVPPVAAPPTTPTGGLAHTGAGGVVELSAIAALLVAAGVFLRRHIARQQRRQH